MYKQIGREEEAILILDSCRTEFEDLMKNRGESWYTLYNLSFIYAHQNEKEKALRYLSKAIDIGMLTGWQDLLETILAYENLWDDPEFKAIVKRALDEKAALKAQLREMEERGELDL